MKSEELKHRITLQILETITNENGFEAETWTDFKDLWASVTNLHGREYFEAASVQEENTVKFTIRYTDEIDTTMRIFFKNKQYNINFIDNIKYKNRYIEIKALEVENSG